MVDIIYLGGEFETKLIVYRRLIPAVRNIILSYMVWLMATRTAKLLPHLWHRPQDIIYVPAFILFGYYFAVMKIYALLTLHEVCEQFAIRLSSN